MAGRSASQGRCVCVCMCVFLCVWESESARPAHLNPVPSNPPTQSHLMSCSLSGPNPHILQSSPGHKVPFCPLSSPPRSLLHSISIASSLALPITTAQCHLLVLSLSLFLAERSSQQCAPLLDKPFEISQLGQLITPIPQGASWH